MAALEAWAQTAPGVAKVPTQTKKAEQKKPDKGKLASKDASLTPVTDLAPPKPFKPPLAAEARSNALYDEAIAKVRDRSVDPEVAKALRDALARVGAGDVIGARALAQKANDPLVVTFVNWSIFRGGYGTSAELKAFAEAHPAWPDRTLIVQRAEEALFNGSPSSAEVRAFFAKSEPRSAVGFATLAAALLADKDMANAKAAAVRGWIEFNVSSANEAAFLKRVGPLLGDAEHKRRLDKLMAGPGKLGGGRAERVAAIKRTIALLSSAEDRKSAEARLALFLQSKDANKLVSKLPNGAQVDWGMSVQKARQLRRQKKEAEAWKLLLAEPEGMETKPDGWWEERRTTAYAALRKGQPKVAYDLVRNWNALSVNASRDATFLSGWIALTYLKDKQTALADLEAAAAVADSPITVSRAHYWIGRTHEAMGKGEAAQEAYRLASRYVDNFYSQLARLKLDPKTRALQILPPAVPSEQDIANFNESDAIAAIVLARKAGLDMSVVRTFFHHLRYHLKTEAEVAMLAHLALALGDTQSVVRIGKIGVWRGMNLLYYAYPIHSLPEYKPLRDPPEPAFILGVARQESEFNTVTKSHAGARGILQVMPVTARHICADYKIKCEIDRLMKDPAYNTMMGSAYIGDRMEEFSGSYVLTIAGYNAGPGRARQWINEFGDPRDPKVDPIDWIHRIPFTETREYVQKVLSNIQVYRARLGDEANGLRLGADLKRVAAAKPAPAKE